ncbi:hypothetical protein SD71_06770 [Cohnella kolymensis]|uniref:Flagellar assembly factor FliW n=1 Tax=Cohnella kolymensis TaxID=1590652 RepID=A0ABR5A708_9BACL|nr:flagellar assembly protein FliW [Cohnella kolymensis]KIL36697.1 hypothetical protein SD71_06770 [Cohnella kolymensis]
MWQSLIGKTINMNGSILGFPELNVFGIQPVDDSNDQSPFAYLQSQEQQEIGFLVVDPFTFFPHYELELSDRDKSELEVADSQEVAVLGIVSIARPFESSTVNLMAPLLINVSKFTGRQLVLPPDTPYQTKTPIFAAKYEKGGNPDAHTNT